MSLNAILRVSRRHLHRTHTLLRSQHSATASAAAITTASLRPQHALYEEPPLRGWDGGDVRMVVHDSFEHMVPNDEIMLPGIIFNAPIRHDLVHRVVHWQLAKRRQGTAKTKNRSEVVGSGRKIRPQKGSGRSRHGDIRSPIFRGGGTVHGPVPRDHSYALPFNVRRNALRAVLTSRLRSGQLWVVRSVEISDKKTKTVVDCMDRYAWRSALVVDDFPEGISGVPSCLHRAAFNVRHTLPINALGINVYDILSFNHLVLTTAAVDHLSKRFAKYDCLF